MATGAIITLIAVIGGLIFIPVAIGVLFIISVKSQKEKFNQGVPGYNVKMSNCPFENTTVAYTLDKLVEEWSSAKKHNKNEIKNILNDLIIEWLPGTKEPNGSVKRYIIDSFNRKIAGDHKGNHIRVVFLKTDSINNTAFVHECCHELQEEFEQLTDRNHTDDSIWGNGGIVSTVKKEIKDGSDF